MKETFLALVTLVGLIGTGCVLDQETRSSARPASAVAAPNKERIAQQLAQASPLADPADAGARDIAAAKLAACQDFRTACGDKLLWGGCEPVKGFDPNLYTLTEFDPLVWLKLYASTIMFTGEYEVRSEGKFSVLEMKAKFRSGLDPGDYPYPFWHSPKKWQAYLDLSSLCVVFQGDRIVAAYRVANPDPSKPRVQRQWDGKWQCMDAEGKQQPRVALFAYMFGSDNPHRASVDAAYRKLEQRFRTQNCTSCHTPDNAGKAKALLMLNYPNQSLVGRHKLLQVLRVNTMPPEDTQNNHPEGIPDKAARMELIKLAKSFVKEADAAIEFEESRKTAPGL